jgi:hypothetical protein
VGFAVLLICCGYLSTTAAAPKQAQGIVPDFRPKPSVPIGLDVDRIDAAVPGVRQTFGLHLHMDAGLSDVRVELKAGDDLLLNGPGPLVAIASGAGPADIEVAVTPLTSGPHYLTVHVSALDGTRPVARSVMVPIRTTSRQRSGRVKAEAPADTPADTSPARGRPELIQSLPASESVR